MQELSSIHHSSSGIIQKVSDDKFELATKVSNGYVVAGDVVHAIDNFYPFMNKKLGFTGIVSCSISETEMRVQNCNRECDYTVAGEHFALDLAEKLTYRVGDTVKFEDGSEELIIEDGDHDFYLLEGYALTVLWKSSIESLISESIKLHGKVVSSK